MKIAVAALPSMLCGLLVAFQVAAGPLPDGEIQAPGAPGHAASGIPKAPNPYFFAERAFPQDRIPLDAWRQAQLQARSHRERMERTGIWEFLGPTNIGGRITDLAVDPRDDAVVYAGAAEGGVLRSTDAGQSWTPLFDDQTSISIGALALDPSDPNVIYAGTGEVNPGGGSVAYGGTGIYRSTDQGDTWESLGLEETGSIGRIRVDPANSDRIFVAAMGRLWDTSSERGVYRTTDGGDTWERVLFVADDTGCVDLVQRPDDPDVVFAALWQRTREPDVYDYGGPNCAVYRTDDGGDSWNVVGGGLKTPSSNGGRIGVSLCAGDPDVMHVIYADRSGDFDGLYRSTNGGTTWSRTNDGGLSSVFATYGWWFGNVRTHPVDPERIYVLGLEFYRSTNGGGSYSNASGSMHVDHHALEFGSGANPILYEGNDGGVYRSSNGGTGWSKLPDLPITQAYRIALDAGDPDALYAGTQDNGTVRTLSGSIDAWSGIFGGDGFQPLVHPTNSNRIWAQFQYGNLYYSSNGGGSFTDAISGIGFGDRRNWNSPLVQDPTNADRRYFGTNRLYRSTGNTSWTAVSGDLTGGPGSGNAGQVNGTLTTIAVSPVDDQVLWTGSDDGFVQVSTNGGSSWTLVSGALPERWITSVRTSPNDRETALVTISGFRWDEPLPHVFRTTDLGASWEPIAGDLPEAPANDLVVDPDDAGRYFVATDVGVYQTVDGGVNWSVLGTGLPNVVVTSLAFDPDARRLFAGTYGRSCFAYELGAVADAPEPLALDAGEVLAPYPNPATDEVVLRWRNGEARPSEAEILTVSGRRVWSRAFSAGEDVQFRWDLRTNDGLGLPAGVYYLRVTSEGRVLGGRTLQVGLR